MNPQIINVDFFYYGKKYAPNGAATFIRSLDENKHLFLNKNIRINVITQDDLVGVNLKRNANTKNRKKSKRDILINYSKSNIIMTILAVALVFLRMSRRMVKLYLKKDRNPDIIIFNELYSAYFYHSLKKVDKAKTVIIFHSNGVPMKTLMDLFPKLYNTRVKKIIYKKVNFVVNIIDQIVFLSSKAQNNFINSNIVKKKINSVVIHNGISDSILGFKKYNKDISNIIDIIIVGTVYSRKGHDLLFHAFNKLDKEYKKRFRINIIGKIDDPSIIDILHLSSKPNFIFHGIISNEQIIKHLQNADIFMLCSRDEGMPVAIIEAMRVGLPIFATNVGAIPEMIIPDVSGIIFEPDEEMIFEILKRLVNNEYNLSTMSMNSRQLFQKKFTIEHMISGYCKTINGLVNKVYEE